jgi:hypothetical protein
MLAIDIFVHLFQGNKQVDNVGGNEKFKTFHIINDTIFDIENLRFFSTMEFQKALI